MLAATFHEKTKMTADVEFALLLRSFLFSFFCGRGAAGCFSRPLRDARDGEAAAAEKSST